MALWSHQQWSTLVVASIGSFPALFVTFQTAANNSSIVPVELKPPRRGIGFCAEYVCHCCCCHCCSNLHRWRNDRHCGCLHRPWAPKKIAPRREMLRMRCREKTPESIAVAVVVVVDQRRVLRWKSRNPANEHQPLQEYATAAFCGFYSPVPNFFHQSHYAHTN